MFLAWFSECMSEVCCGLEGSDKDIKLMFRKVGDELKIP
jgi:hypothetical protein